MGYAPSNYQIYDLEKRIVVEARNVIFDEGRFFEDVIGVDCYVRTRVSETESNDEQKESKEDTDILEEESTELQV